MGKLTGPGRLGSIGAVKKSLKGGGQQNVRTIPSEDSITVRFLQNPEDWHGYYEHWMKDGPIPCVSDDCVGCDSDVEDERKKSFRYLANAYIVDDQKVRALKMPKTLVEMLVHYHAKYKGTLLDRDYELSRTGSGKNDTKYMAAPDAPSKMNLSRFKSLDLTKILNSLLDDEEDDDDDDDDEPVVSKKRRPKKSEPSPWEDDDDDDDDEPVRRVKKKSASAVRRPAKKVAKKRAVRK